MKPKAQPAPAPAQRWARHDVLTPPHLATVAVVADAASWLRDRPVEWVDSSALLERSIAEGGYSTWSLIGPIMRGAGLVPCHRRGARAWTRCAR